MDEMKDLIDVLLVLIPLTGTLRGIYCAVLMGVREEERNIYKQRLKNLLWFIAIAESCVTILSLALRYIL